MEELSFKKEKHFNQVKELRKGKKPSKLTLMLRCFSLFTSDAKTRSIQKKYKAHGITALTDGEIIYCANFYEKYSKTREECNRIF